MKKLWGDHWSLHKLQDKFGRELGLKIHNREGTILLRCYNKKCKSYSKECEVPKDGIDVLYCEDCGTYYFSVNSIYIKICKDYENSKKSKDAVEVATLNHIYVMIQVYEKRQPRNVPDEVKLNNKAIKEILSETGKETIKIIDDILRKNSKDKKSYWSKKVEQNHRALGFINKYLASHKITEYEDEYRTKNSGSLFFTNRKIKKNNDLKSKDGKILAPSEGPSTNTFGTGFFVSNKGHIITNFHVVRNSNNIKFIYNSDEVDAKLIESDQQLDLALLKSKVKNKNYIKFSNKSPQKAQNILVAGFPFGKVISSDLKITGGIINSLKGGGNDTTRFQIDATVNPGNSGGPIVDKVNGSLVGVAVARLSKDFTKEVFGAEGENTNYGIKASQVRDFLESNNIKISIKKNKIKISDLENSTVFIYNK